MIHIKNASYENIQNIFNTLPKNAEKDFHISWMKTGRLLPLLKYIKGIYGNNFWDHIEIQATKNLTPPARNVESIAFQKEFDLKDLQKILIKTHFLSFKGATGFLNEETLQILKSQTSHSKLLSSKIFNFISRQWLKLYWLLETFQKQHHNISHSTTFKENDSSPLNALLPFWTQDSHFKTPSLQSLIKNFAFCLGKNSHDMWTLKALLNQITGCVIKIKLFQGSWTSVDPLQHTYLGKGSLLFKQGLFIGKRAWIQNKGIAIHLFKNYETLNCAPTSFLYEIIKKICREWIPKWMSCTFHVHGYSPLIQKTCWHHQLGYDTFLPCLMASHSKDPHHKPYEIVFKLF
jgi:predicted component of type VI protein secretion system